MTRLSLYQALDIFQDHTADIALSLTETLETDLKEIDERAQAFGTSWVADEVNAQLITSRCGALKKRIKAVMAYHRDMMNTGASTRPVSDSDIAKAREYPIEEMYAGNLQKATGKFSKRGVCPFHEEKTASFYISKENRFKCFGCGEYGDAITFHMKITGNKFIQSVKKLSV
jgi:hypothetical protein